MPTIVMTVNAANNRVTMSGGSSFTYDANGNVLSGPRLPAGLSYDYRNRLAGAAGTMYAYDGANRRVWKGTTGGGQITGETYFLYDLDGTQIGSYALTIGWNGTRQVLQLNAVTNHIYFAGKHVAEYQYGSYSVTAAPDRLGSEMTYYPYGEEKGGLTSNDRVKYATYWRDGESGLDYGVNRYYSASMGRFLSADPAGWSGGVENPQSWNRYAYVQNDPVNWNDRRGLDRWDPNTNTLYGDPPGPIAFVSSGAFAFGDAGHSTAQRILPLDPSPNPDAAAAGAARRQRFRNPVNSAVGVADSALGRPDCLKTVFGGAPATGPDSPQQMLDNMTANNNIVQTYDADATVSATPGKVLDPSGGGLIDVISINSNPRAGWQAGFASVYRIDGTPDQIQRTYDAITLVHELAHIYADEYGLDNQFNGPDRDNGKSGSNDFTVFMHCFN